MRRFAIAAVVLAAALGVLSPAAAQDGPVGIAFVEAPEQSGGVCTGGNLDRAFACARQKCVDGGAEARDCLRVAWCYPAGWSVDVFMQHREGPHWHSYSCGWGTREAAVRAAALTCDKINNPDLIECTPVRIWNPDGREVEVE
jgi:hypothetical protein